MLSVYMFILFFFSKYSISRKLYILTVFTIIIFALLFIAHKAGTLEIYLASLEYRFFSESEVRGGLSRFYETLAGLNYLVSEFPVSLLGMGLAASELTSFFAKYYPITQGFEPRIHNTFISVLVENGLIGFFIFIYMLYRNSKWILTSEDSRKPFYIALYVSTLVGSLFIWNLYYLPFYIVIFYIPRILRS